MTLACIENAPILRLSCSGEVNSEGNHAAKFEEAYKGGQALGSGEHTKRPRDALGGVLCVIFKSVLLFKKLLETLSLTPGSFLRTSANFLHNFLVSSVGHL